MSLYGEGNLVAVHLGVRPQDPDVVTVWTPLQYTFFYYIFDYFWLLTVSCLLQPFLLTETKGPRSFKTRVVTQVMENGPTPDTAAFIQKVEEVRI